MSKPHWFRGSKSPRIPLSWGFFYVCSRTEHRSSGLEVETFRCAAGCVVGRRGDKWTTKSEIVTDNLSEWWQWIADVVLAEKSAWVYGYRISQQLTLTGMWSRMETGEYRISDPRPARPSRSNPTKLAQPNHGIAVVSDPPTILVLWHKSHRQLRLLDLLNIYALDVADTASLIGLAWPQSPPEDGTAESWAETAKRRRNAIRAVIEATVDQWRIGGHGSWRASLSGLAMSSYRASISRPAILIDTDARARGIVREGYYGGETRAFRLGRIDGPVYEVDLASAYTWSLACRTHPGRLLEVIEGPTVRQLGLMSASTWASAVVLVDSDLHGYTVRRGGETRRNVGIYWTTLCGDELISAIERDIVQECLVAAVYSRNDLFSKWALRWWNIRSQAERERNGILKYLAKSIPNAFYGRWAMRTSGWVPASGVSAAVPFGHFWVVEPEQGTDCEHRSIGGWVERRGESIDAEDTQPAIASSVTAAVRVEMRRLVEIAGDDQCLWQAVDCLWVNQEGFNRLSEAGEIRQGELGRLRLHGVYDWVVVHGPHAVETDRDLRYVGLRPSFRRVEPDVFRQRVGPRLSGIICGHTLQEYTTAETDYHRPAWHAVGPINEFGTIGLARIVDSDCPARLRRLLRPQDMTEDDADNEN